MSQNTKAHKRINQYKSCALKHVGNGRRKKEKWAIYQKPIQCFGSTMSVFLEPQGVEFSKKKMFNNIVSSKRYLTYLNRLV